MTATAADLKDFSALLDRTRERLRAARRDIRRLQDQNGKLSRLALAVKAWRLTRYGTLASRDALKVVDEALTDLPGGDL